MPVSRRLKTGPVVHTDDKNRIRLNIIGHLLSQIHYTSPSRKQVALPARQDSGGYQEPLFQYRLVPDKSEVLTERLLTACAGSRDHGPWRGRDFPA